jgi:SAM-dependent methyltransferase
LKPGALLADTPPHNRWSLARMDRDVTSYRVNALMAVLNPLLPEKPKRILVVGCGTGEEAGILARSYGADTIGIDLVTEFTLDHAQAAPATLLAMDAREMRFEDASFDFIYSFHALEHITGPERALQEMRRVLKPGGHYLIGTPNKARLIGYIGSGTSIWNKIHWNAADWSKRLTGQWRNEAGAHAGFTTSELTAMCRSAFGAGDDVSPGYYLALYARRAKQVRMLLNSGLAPWLFPAIYVHGQRA